MTDPFAKPQLAYEERQAARREKLLLIVDRKRLRMRKAKDRRGSAGYNKQHKPWTEEEMSLIRVYAARVRSREMQVWTAAKMLKRNELKVRAHYAILNRLVDELLG